MRTESYRLAVRWRATAKLKAPPRQVRVHSAEQVAAIARTIEHFGFNDPILTDGAAGIVGRLAWWLAAQSLGLEKVPTIPLAHLSEVDRRAFVIAHEALAEQAGWDEALLSLELGELRDLGFDLTLTGLGDERLAAMLVAPGNWPEIASGERSAFEQMTFVVTHEQAACVKAAIKRAHAAGDYPPGNENGNGNALARIAAAYA